ncbi:MAG: ABC transporter ATP-binding protein/permease [Candidatus Nomurabacteria bacterium]|jgi:ATP-binding cassette subfamily B protein|nr:ABC transporter ATP-binding protein/permease [Candidatus Nomurabacteria bacterium]
MTKKKEKSIAQRTMYYYWRELMKNKRYFIALLIIEPIAIALGAYVSVYIFSEIINMLSSGKIMADQVISTFMPYVILLVLAMFISEALWRVVIFISTKLETRVVYGLNRLSFDVISEQSMNFHNNRFGGSLVSAVNKFSGGFARLNGLLMWNILYLIVALIFNFAILGPTLPAFAICMAILSLLFVSVAWISFKGIRVLNEREANAQNKLSGRLADSITNILSVKSYGREQHEKKLYADVNGETQRASLKLLVASTKRDIGFGGIIVMIQGLFVVLLAFGGLWFGTPVGTLILAIMYGRNLVEEIWGVNRILRDTNRAFGDAYDMTMILDETNDVVDARDARPLAVTAGAVDFRAIDFTHADGNEAVFDGLSLDIRSGERIGLVGRSGSGKTTLTKLLLRFADVQKGEILIDGQNISAVTQESLRKNIAYVPQETTLFHRTIAENIAYGRPDASRAEIVRAAKLANAWEFIKDLPKELDTLTGERGVKLSGGQRQRVAIARAILKDAPLLVLDEATASLDTESEKLIQEALSRLMKGRTSIVIAHRLSTVAEMDRIIVLEHGKIVEDGSHVELLKRGGIYATLWNKQTGMIE